MVWCIYIGEPVMDFKNVVSRLTTLYLEVLFCCESPNFLAVYLTIAAIKFGLSLKSSTCGRQLCVELN